MMITNARTDIYIHTRRLVKISFSDSWGHKGFNCSKNSASTIQSQNYSFPIIYGLENVKISDKVVWVKTGRCLKFGLSLVKSYLIKFKPLVEHVTLSTFYIFSCF